MDTNTHSASNDIATVPSEICQNSYGSLVELFDQSIAKYGQLPAFDCMGTSISFDTLDRRSRNFAAYLQQELALPRGSRVAIQLPNVLQYPIALLGILRAGMIVVTINPLYTAREMKLQLIDSGAETIIILKNFAHQLETIISKTRVKHIVVTEIGDQLGLLKGMAINMTVRYLKKMIPTYRLPGAVSFNEALRLGGRQKFQPVVVQGDDAAFFQYTGGTTGVVKAAVLSHTNVSVNVSQLSVLLSARLQPGQEVVITPLPLYHIYALSAICLIMIKFGARNVLITNPRDLKGFIRVLTKYRFTVFSGINTLYNGLLHHPDFDTVDWSHLKIASSGGMALQTAVADMWRERTGTQILEGYGLSETSPVLTFNIPIDDRERKGTAGIPVPGTTIKVVDEDGKEVPLDQPGEILAKGPQIMKEYWNRPQESIEAFTDDGWFKTGDIGTMDAAGFLRIVDRKKEMIVVSGFKVFPSEVEEVVAAHDKVLEVGAIGVRDSHSMEAVKIFVVKKDPSLTREELLLHCRENLTLYKIPKHIEFRDELPKSNVGKVLRRLLKKEEHAESAG
jgi:long-chain acyl-CoA synthetase